MKSRDYTYPTSNQKWLDEKSLEKGDFEQFPLPPFPRADRDLREKKSIQRWCKSLMKRKSVEWLQP